MTNIPKVRLGLVAVSRDCFPIELSRKRSLRVAEECRKAGLTITRVPTVVENEKDALQALEELRAKKVNALVIYLGNFGPEGPGHPAGPEVRRPGDVRGRRRRVGQGPHQRARRRLLRHAQRLLQHRPAQAAALYPGIPRGHARGGRGDDRRVRPGRADRPRPGQAEDLLLRAAAAGFPGLQRPDQAALRPRRRDHGEQRTRPLRRLPQGRGQRQRSRRSRRTWPRNSAPATPIPAS